jgi:hypothetical protein
MADFILRHKEFPQALQEQIAERLYLEDIGKDAVFAPFILPETIRVSVNPKNGRPFYVVHWGVFDGSQTCRWSTWQRSRIRANRSKMLVTKEGKLNPDVDIPLPVGGLLNPEFARAFDASAERNGAYSLSPVTIAQNLDADFEYLHPKQLRRFVLGPFYSAGVTENSDRISTILSKVRKDENAWLLTWTMQEVFSKAERPAKRGLVEFGAGARRVSHRNRRSGGNASGCQRLPEACAGSARSLPGAVCVGRGRNHLRGLHRACDFGQPGHQRGMRS